MDTDEYGRSSLRRALRDFGATDEGASRAVAALEPFFRIAAKGAWPLDRGSTADVGEIARILWAAANLHVKGCIFAAACVGQELPPETITRSIQAAHAGVMPPLFMKDAFEIAFDKALGMGLHAALKNTARVPDIRSPWFVAQRTLRTYAVLVAIGDGAAERLAPLVALLPSYIPLAEDRREGVWHVLSGC